MPATKPTITTEYLIQASNVYKIKYRKYYNTLNFQYNNYSGGEPVNICNFYFNWSK